MNDIFHIKTQLCEYAMETCPDSVKLRIAYEWLRIEIGMKGKKWFLRSYLNKGKVLVAAEEEKMYWVFESLFELTLENTRPTELHDVQLWEVYNSQNPPYYVEVLKGKTPNPKDVDVPWIIRELWEELKAA